MTQIVPKTLYQKIWDAHVVPLPPTLLEDATTLPSLLYIDRHLIHEVTSPQAFEGLRKRGLPLRRPERTLATVDHSIPTVFSTENGPNGIADAQAARQIATLTENCDTHGLRLLDVDSGYQGIVHVIGPELGFTLPGHTIVCGDSHTATHGAFGALAFGIGTSEIEHVFATQCLLQSPSKTFNIDVSGRLGPGVSAKDLVLAIIARIGVDGGTGYVLEYSGPAVRALSMEGRMTLCNMSIEAGARAGMVAPDETTFAYLSGRQMAPQGAAWEPAVATWRALATDPDAVFDKVLRLDASQIEPMVTYGTNPAMGAGISQTIPDPDRLANPMDRQTLADALAYMGLQPGQPLAGIGVDVVFIGSCTNARLEDLQEAANVLRGRRIHPAVRALVVPGSQWVKRQAEEAGLHHVFEAAGCQWREPGCSMCIAMNGDSIQAGQVCASTSNRNFKGRQGQGGRTLLMSPAMAAAAALEGRVVDVRQRH